jgi:outer membrane protein assembly factor BamB
VQDSLKLIVTGLLICSGLCVRAEDWPQWRGPRGDNISTETGLADSWPADGPKQLWSVEVGIGYSSAVAVKDRIYQMSVANGRDVLYCLEPDTGKIVWKNSYDGGYTGSYPGVRATPTILDGKIYTYGGNSDLACWNQADGKLDWRLNVIRETGAEKNLEWGTASNPLIVGDLIYVQNGAGGPVAVAVNRQTGKIVWQSEKGLGGYAHIIQVDVDGTKQLIVFGGKAVYGMNPQTGATIWKDGWETQYDVNASTPIYADGKLFLTTAYNTGHCAIFDLTKTGATKVYESRDVTVRFQGAILDGGKLYANSEGTIKCVEWPTGKVLWSAREPKLGMGGALLRIPGKRFIATSEPRRGVYMMQETDTGLKVIGEKRDAMEGKNELWATPLVYKGKLYVKGEKNLVCFDISGK